MTAPPTTNPTHYVGTTTVQFFFLVEHILYLNFEELAADVNRSVQMSVSEIIKNEFLFLEMVNYFELKLRYASSKEDLSNFDGE